MLSDNNKKMPLQTQQLLDSKIIAYIVSQIPGRLRLRIAKESRKREEIERIAKVLQERLEIYRLRNNLQTGSITIFYAKEHSNFEQIRILLQQLGVSLQDSISKPTNTEGRSEAGAEVISTFSQLNRRVKLATDDAIDLRFLVPLGFSILAARQLLLKGFLIETIPWYVLAWYAFDSFIKFHYSTDNKPNNP